MPETGSGYFKREYKLICSNDEELVSKHVKALLHDGWELWGSPFFNSQYGQYCQAMTKGV